MLSISLIERSLQHGEHDRLLQELAANGTTLPLPLRARLAQSPVPAIALGLRRLCELTYGPTALSRRLTRQLLDFQRPDGAYHLDDRPDPLATAAAASALARIRREHPAAGDHEMEQAHDHAIAALASMQSPSQTPAFACPADRDHNDRLLTAAFVMFLLADNPLFRQRCRLDELDHWLQTGADRLAPAGVELWEIARLDAAGLTPPASLAA